MFRQIKVSQLKERLAGHEALLLIDVRQPDEHDEAHIPNSILIPLAELPQRLAELAAYRDQELIIYCKAGVRSSMACKFLAAHGFSRLFNLTEGMLGW